MRVAIEAQSTVGHGRGVGTYVRNLAESLLAFEEPGLEIVLLRRPGRAPNRLLGNIVWDQLEVPFLASRSRADVLHCAGSSAAALAGRPVVVTVHDLIPSALGGFGWRGALYWKHWLRYSIRFASVVVAVSESTRRDLLRFARVPEERIEVIPLGVSTRFRPPRPEDGIDEVLSRHGLRRPYILAIGAAERHKNIAELLDAFSLSRRQGKLSREHTLAIAGRWSGAADAAKHEGVLTLGLVPDDDLVALFQAADAFVYPSAYEGFGLCPLEAMACGTPVIAVAATSIPEVCGDAAILIEPPVSPAGLAGALDSLMGDAAARKELSRLGVERARRFDWTQTARKTLRVYERVAGGAPPRP